MMNKMDGKIVQFNLEPYFTLKYMDIEGDEFRKKEETIIICRKILDVLDL